MTIRRVLHRVLVASAVVLAVGVVSGLSIAGAAQRPHPTATTWIFQGRVYEGDVGVEPPDSQPLQGVTVSVYGANNPYPDPGTFIRSTTTDSQGWYGLPVYDDDGDYEFYHIRETDPSGYDSVGATSVDGTVRTSNWIEYAISLAGKTLTGNKFWDQREPGDLGDAPDSTNHLGVTMTAYPAGGPPGVVAKYPTVFDPATGLPQGPRHWNPQATAFLGPWVTLENDADSLFDAEGVTNIDPPTDTPDRDGADDGLLYPVVLSDCVSTVITYTVTVMPGAPVISRFVNVWFDWNRDGDWADVLTCTVLGDAPEWAVQNQVITLGPGSYVLQTPTFLPYNPTSDDPMWMRISIAEEPAPMDPGTSLADGRGPEEGYYYGETEDYYLQPEPDVDYDIYLKDNDIDDGSVPSSSPWWKSPDIWVRNDGDCSNTAPENPTAGATTTVCVRVRNRMTTAVTNISVDVYWASAALALSWPGSWSHIGSFNIPSLTGGAETVQPLSWSVPSITGHFCLQAHAGSLQDPLWSGPDTVVLVDKIQNNNNIAQRNTNIVDYPQITECGVYTTTVHTDTVYFDAVNPWNTQKTIDIEFDSDDFQLGSGTIIVEPGNLWGRWNTLTNFNQSGTTLTPTAFPATMGGIEMALNETARITMTIAAEIDERFTIDIKELVAGNELGGIEYVRDLPWCVYTPLIMNNYP